MWTCTFITAVLSWSDHRDVNLHLHHSCFKVRIQIETRTYITAVLVSKSLRCHRIYLCPFRNAPTSRQHQCVFRVCKFAQQIQEWEIEFSQLNTQCHLLRIGFVSSWTCPTAGKHLVHFGHLGQQRSSGQEFFQDQIAVILKLETVPTWVLCHDSWPLLSLSPSVRHFPELKSTNLCFVPWFLASWTWIPVLAIFLSLSRLPTCVSWVVFPDSSSGDSQPVQRRKSLHQYSWQYTRRPSNVAIAAINHRTLQHKSRQFPLKISIKKLHSIRVFTQLLFWVWTTKVIRRLPLPLDSPLYIAPSLH